MIMSSGSITETKRRLSAILASLENGSEDEHVIKRRNIPIAIIVPYRVKQDHSRTFGFAKDNGKEIDWEAFDAIDNEIAKRFGT